MSDENKRSINKTPPKAGVLFDWCLVFGVWCLIIDSTK
jgi:hypothetical protein